MLRRSWVTVNLKRLEDNLRIYTSCLKEKMQVMCVVKADAYGHGAERVVKKLTDCGCRNFAVSNIEEAIEIRKAGAEGQILILGYTPIECAQDLIEYDITQALISEEYARKLSGKGVKAQFAIDTGMNRIGLDADDPDLCENIIRKFEKGFRLTGLFTHLCVADTPEEENFTRNQIEKFKAVAARVSNLKLPYVHCMNSAGGIYEEGYGDLARLGIILYGLKPDRANILPDGIKPVLEWKSVIALIKEVHKGETIGYGRTFEANAEMRVATIPTGYADGYNRLLSNKGFVLINGKKAPIVGRVCMDQLMVDISNIPEAQEEDTVTLIGDDFTADEMAEICGTIGYEIVCDITKRVPRIYTE